MIAAENTFSPAPVLLRSKNNRGTVLSLAGWCLRIWRWSFSIGSGLAILSAVRDYEAPRYGAAAIPFWYWTSGELAVFWFWCFFAPLILTAMGRFPIRAKHWLRNSAIHLASYSCLVILYTFYYETVDRFLVPAGQEVSLVGFFRSFSVAASGGLVKYYVPILVAGYIAFYYARLQQEEVRSVKLASALTKAQLAALKTQLQPHFLFNTLHSISSLVYVDAAAADRMIVQLGELLRMTLAQSSADLVPLHVEIEHVSKYLAIEQTRFSDRLSVEFNIDPKCREIFVPSLLLQPIVENSVKHGISKSTEHGRIALTARVEGGRLCLLIEDNGPGDLNSPALREGVGLTNTRERLQHVYDDDFQIQLFRSAGNITTVKLELPITAHDSALPVLHCKEVEGTFDGSIA